MNLRNLFEELWYGIKDFFDRTPVALFSYILFVVSVVLGMFALCNHSVHVDCLRISEISNIETKVVGRAINTCFVKVGDSWVPSDRWIVNDNQ